MFFPGGLKTPYFAIPVEVPDQSALEPAGTTQVSLQSFLGDSRGESRKMRQICVGFG
jgi:hypothetical protein